MILRGLADPVSVYSVFVDGEPAQVGLVRGGDGPYGVTWSAEVDGLAVGANIVTVTSLDENDDVVSSVDFDITRIDGAFQGVNGELAGDTTWTAEEGPYRLVGNLDVPEGVTLTIDPGVVVLVSEDASILVGRGDQTAVVSRVGVGSNV